MPASLFGPGELTIYTSTEKILLYGSPQPGRIVLSKRMMWVERTVKLQARLIKIVGGDQDSQEAI